MTGATRALPKERAIFSESKCTRRLCFPSAMCPPFCSVPPIGTMIVVLPDLTRSRSSVHVSSSRNTESGAWASALDPEKNNTPMRNKTLPILPRLCRQRSMMRARSFLDRPEILIRDYDHAAIHAVGAGIARDRRLFINRCKAGGVTGFDRLLERRHRLCDDRIRHGGCAISAMSSLFHRRPPSIHAARGSQEHGRRAGTRSVWPAPIGLRYRTMRRLPSPTSTARRKPSASSSTLWCEVAACQSKRWRCGRKEHHSNDGIVMLPALREKIASTAAFSVENLLKIK